MRDFEPAYVSNGSKAEITAPQHGWPLHLSQRTLRWRFTCGADPPWPSCGGAVCAPERAADLLRGCQPHHSPDAQTNLPGYFAVANTLCPHSQNGLDLTAALLRVLGEPAAEMRPRLPGSCQTSHHPLPDHRALELGKDTHHLEHGSPAWRRGVVQTDPGSLANIQEARLRGWWPFPVASL
jgi:hypothetical protein